MSTPTARIGYLVGQLPAINHRYLLPEIRYLQADGIDVQIASIREPDRPLADLTPDERALLPKVYFVKRESKLVVVRLMVTMLLKSPLRLWAAARQARSLARTQRLRWRYGWYYLGEALLVARWIHCHGIEHLHASFTATIALIVKTLCGVPISIGVYGFGELYDPAATQLSLKIREAVFLRSVSRHGVSHLMLAASPEHWPKLRHIPLGIEPMAVEPRDHMRRDRFEVVCVGRLSPEKGHRFLVAACRRLVAKNPSVTLRLVGDGPDRQTLEEAVSTWGLTSHVVFEGWVSQERLEAIYRSASACVLASLYEGIPIVLMEAMVREVPCVAPAVGGIPELIVHEKTGLLFTAGDDEELADAITRLMNSPELAHRLGRAGRSLVLEKYDISRNTLELAKEFRQRATRL